MSGSVCISMNERLYFKEILYESTQKKNLIHSHVWLFDITDFVH